MDLGLGIQNFKEIADNTARLSVSTKLNLRVMINQYIFIEPGMNLSFGLDPDDGDLEFFRVAPELLLKGNINFSNFNAYLGLGPSLQFLRFTKDDFPMIGPDFITQIGVGKIIADRHFNIKFQVDFIGEEAVSHDFSEPQNIPVKYRMFTLYIGTYF